MFRNQSLKAPRSFFAHFHSTKSDGSTRSADRQIFRDMTDPTSAGSSGMVVALSTFAQAFKTSKRCWASWPRWQSSNSRTSLPSGIRAVASSDLTTHEVPLLLWHSHCPVALPSKSSAGSSFPTSSCQTYFPNGLADTLSIKCGSCNRSCTKSTLESGWLVPLGPRFPTKDGVTSHLADAKSYWGAILSYLQLSTFSHGTLVKLD